MCYFSLYTFVGVALCLPTPNLKTTSSFPFINWTRSTTTQIRSYHQVLQTLILLSRMCYLSKDIALHLCIYSIKAPYWPLCPLLFLLFLDVTSWRDGGGRALAPTLSGEGAVEGGTGGALVIDGAAGVSPPNSQTHGPPRNPPAGSPALPLPQPPVGPGFPQYRGIMPPFVSLLLLFSVFPLNMKELVS